MTRLLPLSVAALVAVACACCGVATGSSPADAGRGGTDASQHDGRPRDATPRDATPRDATPRDTHEPDAPGRDATRPTDALSDASSPIDAQDACDARVVPRDAGVDSPDSSALFETALVTSPLPLQPDFSPAIHDYYLRCTAGTNALTVTMTAASGSEIALAQPIAIAPSAGASVDVSLAEGGALVVDVTTGGLTDEYWVRCLPHDFPETRLTTHPDAGAPSPGYYLVGSALPPAGSRGYAMVLNIDGVPVWYGAMRMGQGAFDVDDVVPGAISYVGDFAVTASPDAGAYEVHHLATDTTTHVQTVSVPLDLHELRYLPDGDYLVFSSALTRGVDLTGLGGYGAGMNVLDCVIQELGPSGDLVWRWDALDHVDPAAESTYPEEVTLEDGTLAIDVFHCNSIDVTPAGDLLVSARNMDAVFLISRGQMDAGPSGMIVWKMGGAAYSKDGAALVALVGDALGGFHRQHDARWQSAETLSLFDDQTGESAFARALVLAYNVEARMATIAWQYGGAESCADMGSFRVLDGGGGIVGWGVTASILVFSEVTARGDDLVDFAFLDGSQSYRALKVPLGALDLGLMRATAGKT